MLLWARPGVLVFASLWCLVGMGLVGLYDDWLKVRHGSSDGISARFKLAGQGFVALTAFGIVLLDPAYREGLAEIWLPVLKEPLWSAGSLGWPLAACLAVAGGFFILVCVGCSNAVNLTDGLDGLAAGSALMGFGAFALIGYWLFRNPDVYDGAVNPLDMGVFAAAFAGGCLGFLWWNAAPARIFMGDVGALAIGSALAFLALTTNTMLLIILICGINVMEAGSVAIQMVVFKASGRTKRLFRMSPIHHHFEKMGWQEPTVVIRFWIVAVILALIGLATLKIR